jgi:hypothetical protein
MATEKYAGNWATHRIKLSSHETVLKSGYCDVKVADGPIRDWWMEGFLYLTTARLIFCPMAFFMWGKPRIVDRDIVLGSSKNTDPGLNRLSVETKENIYAFRFHWLLAGGKRSVDDWTQAIKQWANISS